MKSFLSTYEEQRREMAKIQLYASLEQTVETPCARCHTRHGDHVRIAAGIDICPTAFFEAAPERTLRLVEPATNPTGDVGRVQPNWFHIGHGAFWAAYLGGLAYLLGWLVPELALFAGVDL